MRLRNPYTIRQAIDLEQVLGVSHQIRFKMRTKEYHVMMFDKNGDLICEATGINETEAWENALQKYQATPKKKTKDELADENESLRAKLAGMESTVENAADASGPASASADSETPAGDDAPPVKRKRGRPKKTVGPKDLDPDNMSSSLR